MEGNELRVARRVLQYVARFDVVWLIRYEARRDETRRGQESIVRHVESVRDGETRGVGGGREEEKWSGGR